VLRLPYLALTGVFALLRLLPKSSTDKDIEIVVLRHQLAVLQRHIKKPRLAGPDRAFLTALLHRIPRPTLRTFHLIPRYHPALAPRPPPPSPRSRFPTEAARQTTHHPQHPSPHPPACSREPGLGLPPHPW
jgi:hypothetical protein